MTRSTGLWIRLAVAAAILAALGLGAAAVLWRVLPADGMVAQGLVVDGIPVDRGMSAERVALDRLRGRLDHRVTLIYEQRPVLTTSLAELGAEVDFAQAQQAVLSVGRRGSPWQRLDDVLAARAGRLAVRLPRCRIAVDRLAERLADEKEKRDRIGRPARWDFEAEAATEHQDGIELDVYGALLALQQAARSGTDRAFVPVRRIAPSPTQEQLAAVDRSEVLARYQTRFAYWGGKAGRAQNIHRAATALDGAALMPGEVMSFNAVVGPRSLAGGFAHAPEIYKGEMRKGVGGGTCQVASTLYAAVYQAGLDIVERSPHSRPSGYVPLGMDATVAYPHVDLKLRNPFAFPIVLRAIVEPGSLAFELQGKERPAVVRLGSETIKVRPYEREVREASWLAEGKVVRKQKGIRGLTVRKIRRIQLLEGTERVEQTTDVYPPTKEVYLVAPGTDVEAVLPPLPEDVAGADATASRAPQALTPPSRSL